MVEKLGSPSQEELELVKSFAFSKGDDFMQAVYFLWLKQNKKIEYSSDTLSILCKKPFVITAYQRKHDFATDPEQADSLYPEALESIRIVDELETENIVILGVPIEDLEETANNLRNVYRPLRKSKSQQ